MGKGLQHFFKGGNGDLFFLLFQEAFFFEGSAGIEVLQLRQVFIPYSASSISGSFKGVIMDDDDDTIFCHPHI